MTDGACVSCRRPNCVSPSQFCVHRSRRVASTPPARTSRRLCNHSSKKKNKHNGANLTHLDPERSLLSCNEPVAVFYLRRALLFCFYVVFFWSTSFKLLHLRPPSGIFFSFFFFSSSHLMVSTAVPPPPQNMTVCLPESHFVQCVRDFPRCGRSELIRRITRQRQPRRGSRGAAAIRHRLQCVGKDSSSGLLTVRLPPSAEEDRGSITHHWSST